VCHLHFRECDLDRYQLDDGTVGYKRNKDVIPLVFKNNKNPPKSQLEGEAKITFESITKELCRICLREEGSISIKTHLPKTEVPIDIAIFNTFNFDVRIN
jgi:hypothetical protein